MNRKIALAALASLGAMTFGIYACSEDGDSELSAGSGEPTGQGPTGSGGSTSVTSAQGGSDVTVSVGQGGAGQGGSCADVIVEAEIEYLPADIIFVIDNSGSMGQETDGVEQNINVNFASIIQSSGVDYQVIMVTDHGTDSYDVCIGPPLSGTTNCNGPPIEVPNQFYHYDINVQSHDSLCTLIDTLYGSNAGGRPVEAGSDPNSIYTNGWASFLRPEAVKVVVAITDDGVNCSCPGTYCTSPALSGTTLNDLNTDPGGQTAALAFDDKLLGLAPAQFGTAADRNYIFYSIVGISPKTNPLDPYSEFEPIVMSECVGGVDPGTGYQWLSKGTGALRFPVCQDQQQTYDAVFQDIASGVIDVTAVPCEFALPEPPPGEELDLNTVKVIYTPGGGGPAQTFEKVDSAAQCAAGKFYIDMDKIFLCPQACSVVEADKDAKLEVKVECGFIPM